MSQYYIHKNYETPKKSPLSSILSELRLISKKQFLQYQDIMTELRKMREGKGEIIQNEDELFLSVKKFAEEMDYKIFTSSIQRKFKVGYARAAELMRMLMKKGIIDERELPETDDEIEKGLFQK